MRCSPVLVLAALALSPLSACDSIHDPNVRPADVLPSGPVYESSEVPELTCSDGTTVSAYGGSCPTAKEMEKARKDEVARKILEIHAHGG